MRQVDERSTGRRTRERGPPPSDGDLPTRQTATVATMSLNSSDLHKHVGVSSCSSHAGQGIG